MPKSMPNWSENRCRNRSEINARIEPKIDAQIGSKIRSTFDLTIDSKNRSDQAIRGRIPASKPRTTSDLKSAGGFHRRASTRVAGWLHSVLKVVRRFAGGIRPHSDGRNPPASYIFLYYPHSNGTFSNCSAPRCGGRFPPVNSRSELYRFTTG